MEQIIKEREIRCREKKSDKGNNNNMNFSISSAILKEWISSENNKKQIKFKIPYIKSQPTEK